MATHSKTKELGIDLSWKWALSFSGEKVEVHYLSDNDLNELNDRDDLNWAGGQSALSHLKEAWSYGYIKQYLPPVAAAGSDAVPR